jgi:cell division protein ZipA
MSDVWLLRTGILIAGILLVIAIYFFGRPRRGAQGRRVDQGARNEERERMEPTLGAQIERDLGGDTYDDEAVQSELDLLDDAIGAGASTGSDLGRRDSENFDKIISLYVAAGAGQQLQGPDIVVAAEKAGLVFGHMNVFHRLMEGHPERGPIFSVANIMKPGSFEMSEIQSLQTPAIAFFLTLPAPLSALEAWDTMLPTAQRMAELLNGVVLDQERNALGRQRIAHIRDELRAYDRQHEAPPIKRSPRW